MPPGRALVPRLHLCWAHLRPHRAISCRRARPLPRRRNLEPERRLGWVPRPCERRRLRGQPQMREDRDHGGALVHVAHDSAPATTRASQHILPRKLVSARRPSRCGRLADARRRGRARCARSRCPARASPSVRRRSSPPRPQLARAWSCPRRRWSSPSRRPLARASSCPRCRLPSPPRRRRAQASSSLRRHRSLRSRCRRAHAAPRALRAAPRSLSTKTPAPARR
jgi:hypothetical protein